MNSRHTIFETFRQEQMNYIAAGNPVRDADLINRSTGVPPPTVTKILNAIPGSWTRQLLSSMANRARRTIYLLTYSALLIRRPEGHSYYEVTRIRSAKADPDRAVVYMVTSTGAEVSIGPMERPQMFAAAINRAIVGDPASPTCNQCRHYQRTPDPQRGNAGHCQFQDIVLGNYDRCSNIMMTATNQGTPRNTKVNHASQQATEGGGTRVPHRLP